MEHTLMLTDHEYMYLLFALGVATAFRSDKPQWVDEMLLLMNAVCREDPDFVPYKRDNLPEKEKR